MKEANEILHIIVKETDKDRINLKNTSHYSITPLISTEWLFQSQVNSHPNPNKTASLSANLLERVEAATTLINNLIENCTTLDCINSIEELMAPYLHVRLSSFYYLESIIPNSKRYSLFIKGKWIVLTNKTDLIIGIENILIQDKASSLVCTYRYSRLSPNLLSSCLIRLQRYLIGFRLNSKQKHYFLSDRSSYYFPKIKDKLKKENKRLITFQCTKDLRKIFILMLINFVNLIFKRSRAPIRMILYPYEEKTKLSSKVILRLIKKVPLELIPEKYKGILALDISNYLNLTISYIDYLSTIFKGKNITSIFHSTRYPDLYALASTLEKAKGKMYLISHGTHTLQMKGSPSFIASRQLALGVLYSNLKSIIHCSQSIFTDNYFDSIGYKYLNILPLGQVTINNKIPCEGTIKNSKLTILHASTFKPEGVRRYYFESSYEYLSGLVNICEKLAPIKDDIEFIVRVRFHENEVNKIYLENILRRFSQFTRLSNNRTLKEDLYKSDCLIAHSSTTLEEGFNSSIPVMSIGKTSYDHLSYYKQLKLPNNHPKYLQLQRIEKLLMRTFIYSTNPLEGRKNNFLDVI